MPGEGDPEALRPVGKPVHGRRLHRLREDGRRARRRRGVQHHPAGGLRAGHRAGHRRPADRRRPHRAELRPGPPGHHRGQRRLRPDQAPAAVPVLAAALADLQRRSSSACPSSTTWSNMFIDDSYVDNIKTKDLVDLGQSVQGVQRRAGSPSSPCPPPATPTTRATSNAAHRRYAGPVPDAIINDDPLPEEKNADNTPVPETPESGSSAGDTNPRTRPRELVGRGDHRSRVTSPCGCRTRPARTGLAGSAASELASARVQHRDARRLPRPAGRRRRCSSPPATSRPPRRSHPRSTTSTIERVTGMGDVVRVVLGTDFSAVTPPSPSGSTVQVHLVRGTSSATTTELPEDLTITNAADTTCE